MLIAETIPGSGKAKNERQQPSIHLPFEVTVLEPEGKGEFQSGRNDKKGRRDAGAPRFWRTLLLQVL